MRPSAGRRATVELERAARGRQAALAHVVGERA
jgi:hypothetical protein